MTDAKQPRILANKQLKNLPANNANKHENLNTIFRVFSRLFAGKFFNKHWISFFVAVNEIGESAPDKSRSFYRRQLCFQLKFHRLPRLRLWWRLQIISLITPFSTDPAAEHWWHRAAKSAPSCFKSSAIWISCPPAFAPSSTCRIYWQSARRHSAFLASVTLLTSMSTRQAFGNFVGHRFLIASAEIFRQDFSPAANIAILLTERWNPCPSSPARRYCPG